MILRHENLIEVFGISTYVDNLYYLMIEYMENRDLLNYLLVHSMKESLEIRELITIGAQVQ